MVMGIIGNTQGVKIASKPAPNASARNGAMPCCSAVKAVGVVEAGAPGLNSENPGGMEIAGAGALGSMVSEAVAVRLRGGRQRVASQTLKPIAAVSPAGPGGASDFSVVSSRNSALFSYVCVSISKFLSKARLGS